MSAVNHNLKGCKILFGITGSIAAYKSALIVRELVKLGADVQVVMTDSAKEFITPLTLSTLSKKPVLLSTINKDNGTWNNHVELGRWADFFLIAPLSAHTLSKMANGLCDNLLMAAYLSAKCPVALAPAMDEDMLHHQTTKENLAKIKNHGVMVIDPVYGELASGIIGEGRMAEPVQIIDFLAEKIHFRENKKKKLLNKKVLVTAGPTYEAIDPVRFIGNHSSGKMGYAIADAFSNEGADVTLVLGPSDIKIENTKIHCIKVTDGSEMLMEVSNLFKDTDITIMAAAVADYKPVQKSSNKIKKNNGNLNLKLVKTTDILKQLGDQKKKNQILAGFALETDNELVNAKKKLKEKNLDFIILNSLNDNGAGFSNDTNKIIIIDNENKIEKFELKPKKEVAKDILNKVISIMS